MSAGVEKKYLFRFLLRRKKNLIRLSFRRLTLPLTSWSDIVAEWRVRSFNIPKRLSLMESGSQFGSTLPSKWRAISTWYAQWRANLYSSSSSWSADCFIPISFHDTHISRAFSNVIRGFICESWYVPHSLPNNAAKMNFLQRCSKESLHYLRNFRNKSFEAVSFHVNWKECISLFFFNKNNKIIYLFIRCVITSCAYCGY